MVRSSKLPKTYTGPLISSLSSFRGASLESARARVPCAPLESEVRNLIDLVVKESYAVVSEMKQRMRTVKDEATELNQLVASLREEDEWRSMLDTRQIKEVDGGRPPE